MGYSKYVHIGAYIEAKNEIIAKDVFEKSHCGKIYKDSDIFCSVCGDELQSKIIGGTTESKINPWDVFPDEMEDNLVCINNEFFAKELAMYDLYISNFEDNTSLEIEDTGFWELTDNRKLNSQKEFLLKFKEEISVLKKAYGEENVSVKFGVIIYYS